MNVPPSTGFSSRSIASRSPSSSNPSPLGRLRRWVVAFVAIPLAACGSPETARPPLVDGGGLGTGVASGPCEEGLERECGYKVDQANGVVTCYEGVQFCEGGEWSECMDGSLVRRPDPSSREMQGFRRAQALSTPIDCVNQPCDPYCKLYDENPDPDVTPGGSSPPTTPAFPGGPGVTACAHDLCTTGAALYNPCTTCTQQVCSSRPSCCTTAWDSTCVSLVYSLCANQRPPLSLCQFGLYSDTTLTVANRGTADAVVAAYGNITIDTDGAVAGVWSKGNITYQSLNGATVTAPFGIIADGSVTSQDSNSTINSFIEAGGNVFIPSWDVQQYVSTAGALSGQNSTTILGNVRANSGVSNVSSIGGTSCTTAGCYTHAPLNLPPQTASTAIPSYPTICTGTTNFTTSGGFVTVPGPGTYGAVNISNNGAILLNGEGTYYFTSFQAWDRVILRRTATNTGAGWDIRVCGTVAFGNGTQFRGQTDTGVMPALEVDGANNSVLMDPSLVRFFAATSSTITMGTDVYFTGVFMAPNATVTKGNMNSPPSRASVLSGTRSAPVNGAIWARSVQLGTDALTKQISRSACEAVLPQTIRNEVCPITNITPAVPPALNEPCRSGLDCQINHRCVEPRTGTTCSHSKCMPGAALSASCDSCVSRICADDPTCCSTSWTQSCVDKVGTICDARCGTYSCYFGDLCSANASVPDRTCNTCVNSICAADPSCCNTAWTQACADRVYTLCGSGLPTAPTTGTSICDYAAYSNGSASITGANIGQNAIIRGGSVGRAGPGSMNLSHSNIEGNVFNAGSFTTYYTTVTGNLVYGSGTNSITAPTSYSALLGPTNPPQPARPTRTFACAGGATPTSGTIAPGNYGNVSIPNGSTLTLQAGTYNFSSLTIGASSGASGSSFGTLALPASGRVTINVCGNVTFNAFSRMTGIAAASAMNIDVYSLSGTIALNANTTTYGVMNAGSGVSVGAGATLFGFAWAGSTISVHGNAATVDARTLSASCRTNFDPNFSTRRIDRLCGYAAYSRTTANVVGTTVSGGDLGAGTTATVTDTSRFFTNVLAQGAVTKGTASTYYQSIRSRSTISGAATVLGTQSANASAAAVPTPTWPTVAFSCTAGRPPGGTDQNLWGGTLSPGTYGHVTLAGDWQTLTLQAGDYYVGNFDLTRNNTTFTLPATGTVRIFACGTVNFGTGLTTLNNPVSGATAGRFRVYSLSTASGDAAPAIYVNRGSSRAMGGVFVAPNGKISVGPSSTLNGVAWADSFFAGSGAIVNAENFAGASCEALSVDTAASCPQVMTSTPPNESGDCQQNVLGYTDGSCPTYDLALDIPCADEVPVCNHGTANFVGNVTLAYYATSRGQMSLATPTNAPDGTCTGTGLTIAPGNCVDVPCAIPTGATYTVRLDPGNTLNECGTGAYNRRLDNWTVDDDQMCMSGGPITVTYDYEAICPTGTIGKWGTLSWNTTTPGTSNIVFSARVAETSAGLAAETWVPIGTAQASPTDTQVCPIAVGAGACYRDLSGVLGLGMVNQPQFLELRMEVTPSGADLPILRDWKVTYSCAFDQ